MLRSLWRIIDEKKWINHPKYLLIASNKVGQLKKAIEIEPNYADAMFNLGLTYLRIGQIQKGEELILKAGEIKPTLSIPTNDN